LVDFAFFKQNPKKQTTGTSTTEEYSQVRLPMEPLVRIWRNKLIPPPTNNIGMESGLTPPRMGKLSRTIPTQNPFQTISLRATVN
jgi:hypothetical protein